MSRFQDCKLHDMTQRSDEWFDVRRDKLTASEVGLWISKEKSCDLTVPELKKELGLKSSTLKRDELITRCQAEGIDLPWSLSKEDEKSRSKAIDSVIAARLGAPDESRFEIDMDGPPPKNPALRAIYYGIKYEAEALSMLSFDQDLDLEEIGFCEHLSGIAGSSPDSLIVGENGIVENKVTMIHRIQVGRLRAKTLPEEHKMQVHFQMATTGADYCWFQSYHYELPPVQVRVERDEFTESIVSGISQFKDLLESEWASFSALTEN